MAGNITSTEQYKKWRLVVLSAKKFPYRKYEEEIMRLHETRLSRNLSRGKANSTNLIEASAVDINVRSRAIELMVQARRIYYNLDAVNEAMRDFLFDKGYVSGRTMSERNKSASAKLDKGVKLAKRFESFIEMMETFVADIDQAQWQMKNIINALEISSRPEAQI